MTTLSKIEQEIEAYLDETDYVAVSRERDGLQPTCTDPAVYELLASVMEGAATATA